MPHASVAAGSMLGPYVLGDRLGLLLLLAFRQGDQGADRAADERGDQYPPGRILVARGQNEKQR